VTQHFEDYGGVVVDRGCAPEFELLLNPLFE